VGGLTATYVSGYSYTVSAAEDASIRKGSSWSDSQLMLSVGSGLLKNITDTVTTIKQPNAKGRSVTLLAGTDIGSYNDPLTIDLSAGLDKLTQAQKAALAAAERGDAMLSGNTITIVQPRPVNVEVGLGALNVAAPTGYALIGSEQDLRIDKVTAADDIRIKTAGSLINAASVLGTVNVVGENVILEAANGGIGSIPDVDGAVNIPLRLNASGDLIARAANDIWIEAEGDLKVDTIYTRNDLQLEAQGSILDAHVGESPIKPDNNLRARNITLRATSGSIGTSTNSLDAGVNADGEITATAATTGEGVYLNGPSGEYFNIGSVTSGDAVSLNSATGMKIDGDVTGPGPISLVAGGGMTMTTNADVHATTQGVFLRAGSLTMDDDGTEAARMRVDVGTIDIKTVGDALITGIETGNGTENAIRVVSTAGRILDNGDTRLDIIADTRPAAKLIIAAALGIGDDQLDVRLLNLEATSGGVVDINVQNGVNVVGITAADRVWLTAGGDVTGASVTSTGAGASSLGQYIQIESSGGSVNLASVSGQADVRVSGQNSVTLASVSSALGDVLANSTGGNTNIGSGSAGGDFTALGFGGVDIGILNAGKTVHLAGPQISAFINGGVDPVRGSITGYGGGIANNVDLTLSGPGGFAFDMLKAVDADINVPVGPFSVDSFLIADRASITNLQTEVLVDQHNKALQPSDIQLYSGGEPFAISLDNNSLTTDSFVIHRSPLHEVITPNGTNTSVDEQGNDTLALVGKQSFTQEEGEGELVDLISYSGMPVSTNCSPDKDPECVR